jgi:hypothetical protein
MLRVTTCAGEKRGEGKRACLMKDESKGRCVVRCAGSSVRALPQGPVALATTFNSRDRDRSTASGYTVGL